MVFRLGYAAAATDSMARTMVRAMNQSDVDRNLDSGAYAWGAPKDVAAKLTERAEAAGTNNLLININLGAMPNKMVLEQVPRLGREVLPILPAHEVKREPVRELALRLGRRILKERGPPHSAVFLLEGESLLGSRRL